MPAIMKASDEVIVSATGIAIVLAIYSQNTPNLADVRADKPGNINTFASTKIAAITSIAVVGTLALLAKSPTVFTVGGAAVLFETWKYHTMNFGKNGTAQNQAAASY
jgi:hypothetical protein